MQLRFSSRRSLAGLDILSSASRESASALSAKRARQGGLPGRFSASQIRRDDAMARGSRLLPPELVFQFCLRPLQPVTFGFRQVLAGAVDIKRQHRYRRAVCAGFSARALFCRSLQRRGDLPCTAELEHSALQIERIALLCDAPRPAPWRLLLRGPSRRTSSSRSPFT